MWLHLHAWWKVYVWVLRSLLTNLYYNWNHEQIVYAAQLLLRDVRLPRALGPDCKWLNVYRKVSGNYRWMIMKFSVQHLYTTGTARENKFLRPVGHCDLSLWFLLVHGKRAKSLKHRKLYISNWIKLSFFLDCLVSKMCPYFQYFHISIFHISSLCS
jgi:hypothetical protein